MYALNIIRSLTPFGRTLLAIDLFLEVMGVVFIGKLVFAALS